MLTPGITDHVERILIVDDERPNRHLLEVMLAPEGFSVQSAASGFEAISYIALTPPDLILLDVMMPDMDGYELATRLKADVVTKNIPIIMVTVRDDREAKMRGLGCGAEDFLSKPVDRAELCVRVRNLLRLKAYGDYHDKYGRLLENEVGSSRSKLVASEARYRRIVETANEGIWTIDEQLTTTFVNARMAAMLGQTVDDMAGRSPAEFLYEEGLLVFAAEVERLKSGVRGPQVEVRLKRKDETLMWVLIESSLIVDAVGNADGILGMVMDITARKQAEQANKGLEEQLRQSQKMEAVGRLAGGVAHDFNNLLSVVLSYSELTVSDLSVADPIRADIQEIHKAGLRAAELTRQLLMFSRQQVVEPKVLDLNEVLASMDKMLRRVVGEDVTLTSVPSTSLGSVHVDRGSIEQVIMNLVINARDAMPTGGNITMETANVLLDDRYAATHLGAKAGRHVMVSVTDTGSGMDKATVGRIFEPFFTTKAPGKGTGLGLSTVFGIAQQSGGTVWVYSEPGIGTTFKVYLPRVDATPDLAQPAHRAAPGRGTETILLVEDEDQVRDVVRGILRRFGYKVLEARNAGEALLLCERHAEPIALLLSDVVMPNMSGPELAKRLAAARPEMKVLCMSGYTDDAAVRHGVIDAHFAYLQKPITVETLTRKVRDVLDG